jgi:hypothetical protein
LTRRRGATAFVARLQRGTPELNGQIPCSNQVWDLFARLSSSNSRTLTPQTPWNLAIGALTREILLSGSNWECLGTPHFRINTFACLFGSEFPAVAGVAVAVCVAASVCCCVIRTARASSASSTCA